MPDDKALPRLTQKQVLGSSNPTISPPVQVDISAVRGIDEVEDVYNYASSVLEQEAWHPYIRHPSEERSAGRMILDEATSVGPRRSKSASPMLPENPTSEHTTEIENHQMIPQSPRRSTKITIQAQEQQTKRVSCDSALISSDTENATTDLPLANANRSASAQTVEARVSTLPEPKQPIDCVTPYMTIAEEENIELSLTKNNFSMSETPKAKVDDTATSEDDSKTNGIEQQQSGHVLGAMALEQAGQPMDDSSRSRSKPKTEVLFYVISGGARTYWSDATLKNKELSVLFDHVSDLASRTDIACILFSLSNRTSPPISYTLTRDKQRHFETLVADFTREIKKDVGKGLYEFELRLEINPGETKPLVLEEEVDTDSDVGL